MIRGFLARIRGWWRSAFGDEDVAAAVEGTGTYDYECTVCGTGVDDPEADCPLCRSSDVVATDTRLPSATSIGVSTRGPDGTPTSGEFSRGTRGGGRVGRRSSDTTSTAEFERRRTVRQHVAAADDEAVERLRDLRGARDDVDLLERHADRWEPHRGGFRVETTAGTRIVDSREDVVALLRATDR